MNWLLLALGWLGVSVVFSLGWAAVMAAERRYCANCRAHQPHQPRQSQQPGEYRQPHPANDHAHSHVWGSPVRRAVL